MVTKGNHPHMALIQVSEILSFTQTNAGRWPQEDELSLSSILFAVT